MDGHNHYRWSSRDRLSRLDDTVQLYMIWDSVWQKPDSPSNDALILIAIGNLQTGMALGGV